MGQGSFPWEVKLVCVLGVYALFKRWPNNAQLILASRAVFVLGNVLLLYLMSRFNQSIMKKGNWTMDRKDKARSAIQKDLVKPLFLRALAVVAIHWKLHMNPPLLVSVMMGAFSFAEVRGTVEKED